MGREHVEICHIFSPFAVNNRLWLLKSIDCVFQMCSRLIAFDEFWSASMRFDSISIQTTTIVHLRFNVERLESRLNTVTKCFCRWLWRFAHINMVGIDKPVKIDQPKTSIMTYLSNHITHLNIFVHHMVLILRSDNIYYPEVQNIGMWNPHFMVFLSF